MTKSKVRFAYIALLVLIAAEALMNIGNRSMGQNALKFSIVIVGTINYYGMRRMTRTTLNPEDVTKKAKSLRSNKELTAAIKANEDIRAIKIIKESQSVSLMDAKNIHTHMTKSK